MHVKTFRGQSTSQVLSQIKAELGDDAVILSTQTVQEGGRNVCEIMAAVDSTSQAAAGQRSGRSGSRPRLPGPADEPLAEAADPQPFSALQREWGQLKDHMLAILGTQMNLDALTPRQKLAMEYLEREGADQGVLLTLWRRLKDDREVSVLSILGELVPVRPFADAAWPQKFHALAGPHGSGKTSCVVRMALEHKRRHPAARIMVANADHNQGKGRMILQHYAELSGLVYREVSSAEDFARIRKEAPGFDRVFIDLPGLGRDQVLDDFLREMGLDKEKSLQVHLVLAPYFAPAQITAFLRKYGTRSLASLIWAKLDEACSYGALVNVALQTGLPVSALSFGSGLRNSLAAAEPMLLWKIIFKHQLPSTPAAPDSGDAQAAA